MIRETIARYEIQSELERGGMATVYLAYDPNFHRKVAIKVVSVNFQKNPVFRDRFECEARLIAGIEHPAIVPVYDFGEQGNQRYLVMRYMPGGTLASKIKESMWDRAATVLPRTEIHPVQQYHGTLFNDNDVKMRLKLELLQDWG